MHRSDEVPPVHWISGPYGNFDHVSLVGEAINAHLSWSTDVKNDAVSLCLCGNSNEGNDGWIGIGFGGLWGNGKKWMLDEDIVVGYLDINGSAVVETMYADTESGLPAGNNTLKVWDGRFTHENGVMTLCFTRPINGGHNPLTDSAKLIWATGPVKDGVIQYHGIDGHDDTGKSQMHRSDEVPPVHWISGPYGNFDNEAIIGKAINMTLKWSTDVKNDAVAMCLVGSSFEGNDGWIGIGFGGQHGNGKKWMLDEDIVVGYLSADGDAVVDTMYSDTESGLPAGNNTLKVWDGVFTHENGVMTVCFTRPINGGHNPLTDSAKVIWATGAVKEGVIQYHGIDGHDDTGESQMHRSDEVAPVPWISGIAAAIVTV